MLVKQSVGAAQLWPVFSTGALAVVPQLDVVVTSNPTPVMTSRSFMGLTSNWAV